MPEELDQLSVEWNRLHDSVKLAHDRLDIVDQKLESLYSTVHQLTKAINILAKVPTVFENPTAGEKRKI